AQDPARARVGSHGGQEGRTGAAHPVRNDATGSRVFQSPVAERAADLARIYRAERRVAAEVRGSGRSGSIGGARRPRSRGSVRAAAELRVDGRRRGGERVGGIRTPAGSRRGFSDGGGSDGRCGGRDGGGGPAGRGGGVGKRR